MARAKASGGAGKASPAAKRQTLKSQVTPVEDYEHAAAKRTNNPPAGLAHLDRDETPTLTYAFDPHIDPQLQWAGKVERLSFEVAAPSVHVHEELSAQNIIASVRRQRTQQALFDVAQLDPAKQVEFYQHEMNWSNRMIVGDSLIVMASLLERERLAGQVQCIYIDPPYGIKYQSNFQPAISDSDVVDGRDEDMTREPEMIQAYRDTWELDVHSYLTHLRDRLALAHELLTDSGSVFVQMSDDHVHQARVVLDEVFGAENFVSQISYVTTSGFAQSQTLGRAGDYILWYAKQKNSVKVRRLWQWAPDRSGYDHVELADGTRRSMSRDEKSGKTPLPEGARAFTRGDAASQGAASSPQPFEFEGRTFQPPRNSHWKANYPSGMERLQAAGRLTVAGNTLRYVRYADDFGYQQLTNLWTDTGIAGFTSDKRYTVQTNPRVIERCVLMTTDPGDLVMDPTNGSGTTAFVCEQWGRRWIAIDTSRVATAIARERLLTAVYPYYRLRDEARDVSGGFQYKTVSRVTLGSIANDEAAEAVTLFDSPVVDTSRVRVAGPFTVEALSRYAVNPLEPDSSTARPADVAEHVGFLLDALETMGIPRPRQRPAPIQSLTRLTAGGTLQAEGTASLREGNAVKFAVSLGPRFGPITMSQVSEALAEAIGYGLVVFAGFLASAEVQALISSGKVGGTDVALLLANPDLLVGDLLKNTKASQTFRLYASPDVTIRSTNEGLLQVEVEGVDSFDASSGQVISFGKSGIRAWFLDDSYDGRIFCASQAFFPATNGWGKLSEALRGTVDAELVEQLHTWTSLPFDVPASGKIAVRVITDDGNASEVVLPTPGNATPEVR